ncbi:hypothetical protein DMB38_30995 [Streptomyces sp. WAC 06738]|uniref:hypothetical protein n=1 Tax=Streptomyces sp. WAC 06738 TaxID=2203210 RepID=UPI000F6BC565|nr:hypothetical protein [Streptomyces sp. WAC 06738]AZM49616.1 hypothetical protein DMB38_30995 [Streptomyces sp. WAC 06738]
MTTSSTARAGAPGAGGPEPEPAEQGPGVRPDAAGTRANARLVAAALADARSGRPVEPDTPSGPARQRWREPARRVPAAGAGDVDLDTVLTLSLAAGKPARAGTSGGNAAPAHGTPGAATAGLHTGRAAARPRAAASAGGRYPVRAHLLVGPGCPLPPGRYAYDPLTHRVHRRGPAPGNAARGVVAVLTVAAQRTVSHYGHRAWPLLLLDTGHAAAALALASVGTGHAARVCLDADGALLAAAAGLPPPGSWRDLWPGTSPEHPLAAVHIRPGAAGPGTSGIPPAAAETGTYDAPPGPAGAPDGDVCPLAAWAAVRLPAPPGAGPAAGSPVGRRTAAVLGALTRAPHAGDRPAWWRARPPWQGGRVEPPCAQGALPAALRRRRSAFPPLAGEPERTALAAVLHAAAAACPSGPAWCAAVGGRNPGLLAPAGGAGTGVVSPAAGDRDHTDRNLGDRRPDSHGAGGDEALLVPGRAGPGSRPDRPEEPGGHAVREEARPYEGAAPAPPLRLMARGEARPALAAWAAGQGWLAGAGAVLLARSAPGDASPAGVRAVHLAAGYAAASAEVTAAALGLRSRPVGSWQRADLGAALGDARGERWVVHGLALAAPEDAAQVGRKGPVPASPAQAAAGTSATPDPNTAGNERR